MSWNIKFQWHEHMAHVTCTRGELISSVRAQASLPPVHTVSQRQRLTRDSSLIPGWSSEAAGRELKAEQLKGQKGTTSWTVRRFSCSSRLGGTEGEATPLSLVSLRRREANLSVVDVKDVTMCETHWGLEQFQGDLKGHFVFFAFDSTSMTYYFLHVHASTFVLKWIKKT